MVATWRNQSLALRRIMLVCWIALSVAVAPIASARASMHAGQSNSGHEEGVSQPTPAAGTTMDMADMADCHKAMKSSSDCPCCDAKAKCPADAPCMVKCCKVLGTFIGMTRLVRLAIEHDRPGEPEQPPEWASKPPSPPPRA